MLLAACSEPPDPDATEANITPAEITPPAETTTPIETTKPDELATAVSFRLGGLGQPEARSCEPGEREVPQPAATANLLRVCRPPVWTVQFYLRLVNLSDTTLVIDVGYNRSLELWPAPGESPLTQAALTTAFPALHG